MRKPLRVAAIGTSVVALLILCACGGLTGSGSNLGFYDVAGLRFVDGNPSTVSPGGTVRLMVEAFPSNELELGLGTNISTTSSAGSTNPSLVSKTFAATSGPNLLVPFEVTVPANTTPGTILVIRASRTSSAAGLTIRPVTRRVTVANDASLSAEISPASVQATVGTNATGTLTVTPLNGYLGTVNLVGYLPDVVIVPSSLTFTNSTPKTATVTYRIPASATVGQPIDVPVRAYQGSRTAIGSFAVTPTAASSGTFSLSVTPSQIFVQGSQVSQPAQVTITPGSGFRGTVTLSFALPGQGSLTLGGGLTNPINVNITSDSAVTTTVPFIYTPGTGGAPMGSATITATGSGTTRTATFDFIAS